MRRAVSFVPALALLLASGLATGQEFTGEEAPAPLRLSIEDAIRLAEDRSEQVVVARAGVLRAEAEKTRALSEILPQVSASLAYQRTFFSEFAAALRLAQQSPGQGSLFSNLPFGRSNTWNLGASFSQNLYTGGRFRARRRLASSNLHLANSNLASTRAEAVLDVAESYFETILTYRLVAIAMATAGQAKETLDLTKIGEQVGARPEFDVLRAQVELDQARTNIIQAEVNRDVALLRFKQLLDIAPEREVQLTAELGDELDPEVAETAREVAEVSPDPESKRAPVIQAEDLVRVREAALDIAKSQRLPQVFITSTLGFPAYPRDLWPSINEFQTNWSAGIALQVPIFTGLRITSDIRAARADLLESQAQLRRTEELSLLDALTARRQLQAAEAVWLTSAGIVLQARRAYELARLRYEKGASSQLELTDARVLLEQALVTRASAARDLQIARIRYALLPNLPLGSASGARAQQVPGAASQQLRPNVTFQQQGGGAVAPRTPTGTTTTTTGTFTGPAGTGTAAGQGQPPF